MHAVSNHKYPCNMSMATIDEHGIQLSHYQKTNFKLFQAQRVCRRQFKFDENGRKLSKQIENTVGKGAISPFPTVFSKGLFPRGVKRCYCMGMGKGICEANSL